MNSIGIPSSLHVKWNIYILATIIQATGKTSSLKHVLLFHSPYEVKWPKVKKKKMNDLFLSKTKLIDYTLGSTTGAIKSNATFEYRGCFFNFYSTFCYTGLFLRWSCIALHKCGFIKIASSWKKNCRKEIHWSRVTDHSKRPQHA